VRGHIEIPSDEKADKRAMFASVFGETAASPQQVTEEGITAVSRESRRTVRYEKGFGQRRTDWDRRALSVYT